MEFSEKVDLIEIISALPFIFRLDVYPFLILYLGALTLQLSSSWEFMSMLAFPVILFLHLVLFILARLYSDLRCVLGFRKSTIHGGTHVALKFASGSKKIVRLRRLRPTEPLDFKPHSVLKCPLRTYTEYFEYQKLKFGFNISQQRFEELTYPTEFDLKGTVEFGINDPHILSLCLMRWGQNRFEIPIPHFFNLFMEHLGAPFFVFQVFCLLLWSLDDYWYYSFLTFVMLVLFEAMLCKQRQSSLSVLRKMRRPPFDVCAFRNKNWIIISSESLVPGDLISLQLNSDSTIETVVPCDCILLAGSCIVNEAMLTGESIPHLKGGSLMSSEPISSIDIDSSDPIMKKVLLLGGTIILQAAGPETIDGMNIPRPPERGCIAVVVRTGFGTVQGSLMRKILFANDMSGSSTETFYFICILVLFACFASAVVLRGGLEDRNRNRFKLVLHCVMIITSVIPPELPMELNLAVTSSLNALSKNLVYCTEPFRIAFAGKVNTICFDKTGTITTDKLVLRGVAIQQTCLNPWSEKEDFTPLPRPDVLVPPSNFTELISLCLATCQSLFLRSREGNDLMGDPLELECFAASGFLIDKSESLISASVVQNSVLGVRAVLLKRFDFNSTDKRMTVIADVQKNGVRETFVFTKGAPETLWSAFANPPESYRDVYRRHMSMGKRVLALGFKKIRLTDPNLSRKQAECDLRFLGFLVFDCELKLESKRVITELRHCDYKLTMITGDSPQTAIDVASRCNFIDQNREFLILEAEEGSLTWSNLVDDKKLDYSSSSILELSKSHVLSMSGSAFDILLQNSDSLDRLVPFFSIFARMSPSSKEIVVQSLRRNRSCVLMCGDGTNDVGALRVADVGISIVNSPELEHKAKKLREKTNVERSIADNGILDTDASLMKLGDASIASSFTARKTTIDSVLIVLRQGRSTLVTTIQVFKILALNCLASAFSMSALYLHGLKQGDIQMTIAGLITAGLFFFLAQAKPVETLHFSNPPSSIFARSVMLSVLGQFLIHIISIGLLNTLDDSHSVESFNFSDQKFQPTFLNSIMFLFSLVMILNNFVMNYRGPPFTQRIQDNYGLWYSVIFIYFVIVVAVGGQFEPLNDLLQIGLFKDGQRIRILSTFLFDIVGTFFVESLCRTL